MKPLQHGTNKWLLLTRMRSCLQGEDRSWNCDLKTQLGKVNSRGLRDRGERSTFCLLFTWMRAVECDILCISFVTTVQSRAPLSVMPPTYWLCVCCGVKRALVASLCPDASLLEQWMDGFLKKTLPLKCPKTRSQMLFMLKEFLFTLSAWADDSNCNFGATVANVFL